MQAVLLAGGQGTRLRPYTANMPKVLLPVDGVPVIELLIGQLREQGVRELTVVVGHLAEMVERHLGTGRRLGVDIRYFREKTPLDTAGCLGQFVPSADPFLFVNADILTDFRFMDLAKYHRGLQSMATVGIARHQISVEFGVVECNEVGSMTGYLEKPAYEFWVSMGIYCLNPRVCEFVDKDERISMPQLLLRLRDAGEPVRCYREDCYWRDIGRPEDYTRATEDFVKLPERFVSRRVA